MLEIKGRLDRHLRNVAVLEGKQQELSRQHGEIQSEVDRLTDDIQVLELVSVLFDRMLADLSKVSLEKMQSLLTAGLSVIFDDQKLSVYAEMKTEKKHPALHFILHDEDRGVKAPIRGNFGGGPVAVADLLLRVLVILKLNMGRVLILDEALSQVSSKYLGNAGEFLNKLCKKLGMTIMLVTHSDFGKSATKVYKAFSRQGELKLLLEGSDT